jgi:hypothetical protein
MYKGVLVQHIQNSEGLRGQAPARHVQGCSIGSPKVTLHSMRASGLSLLKGSHRTCDLIEKYLSTTGDTETRNMDCVD